VKRLSGQVLLAAFLAVVVAAALAPTRTESKPLEVINKNTKAACLTYNGKPLFAFGPMNEELVFAVKHGSPVYDVRAWAKWQNANGMNYVRCYVQSGYGWCQDIVNHPDYITPFERVSDDPIKFDVTRFNKIYWDNFEKVLRTLRDNDVVVHLQLFQQCYFEPDGGNRWHFNFWNPEKNVNDFTSGLKHNGGGHHPFVEQIAEGNPKLRQNYLLYLDHILNAIGDKGNVLIDLSNEMGDGGIDVKLAKQWIELTLDHIEAWEKRTGNDILVGQDQASFPDGEYLMRHPRMELIIAHGNNVWHDWTDFKKPVVLVNLHLRQFILSYGQPEPERLGQFRRARWRSLLSRAQGVGDYQKDWRKTKPGTVPQFDRDARLLRSFFETLTDYPNMLPRKDSIVSAPGQEKYCLASNKEALVYMESGRFDSEVKYPAGKLELKSLPLQGNEVEVTIYNSGDGIVSKNRRQLSDGRIEIDLPEFTDDLAVRILAL
jgi:hypothetical protein